MVFLSVFGGLRFKSECSMILLMSFPAAMGEGTGCGSRTVTFGYPVRARWRAVEQPQVPAPTISICDCAESGAIGIFRAMYVDIKKCQDENQSPMRGCALSVITPVYQASIQSTQTGIIIIKPYYRFLTIPAGPSRLPLCRHLRILYGLIISLSGLVVDILRLNLLLVYDIASKSCTTGITPVVSYQDSQGLSSTGHWLLSVLSQYVLWEGLLSYSEPAAFVVVYNYAFFQYRFHETYPG